jgi:hypothetical protein
MQPIRSRTPLACRRPPLSPLVLPIRIVSATDPCRVVVLNDIFSCSRLGNHRFRVQFSFDTAEAAAWGLSRKRLVLLAGYCLDGNLGPESRDRNCRMHNPKRHISPALHQVFWPGPVYRDSEMEQMRLSLLGTLAFLGLR